MFENAPKHRGLTNPMKNGEKAKKILKGHEELYKKTGYKPIRSPIK